MDVLVTRVEDRSDAIVACALQVAIAGMNNPQIDLPGAVDGLTRALSAGVPSFLGFTITVQTGLRAVRLTTAAPGVVDAANARLLLLLSPGSEPGSSAVFYSAEPGAFDRLATSGEWQSCSYDPVILEEYLPRV